MNMLSRSNLQGSTFEAQHGFIMEYYLIVISIACVKRKIIKLKYPVACSRSVGAAGERDLLWSMIWGRAIQAFRVLGPSSLITRRFLEGAVLEVANHCRYT